MTSLHLPGCGRTGILMPNNLEVRHGKGIVSTL